MQVILQVYENKAKCQVLDFSDFVIFQINALPKTNILFVCVWAKGVLLNFSASCWM